MGDDPPLATRWRRSVRPRPGMRIEKEGERPAYRSRAEGSAETCKPSNDRHRAYVRLLRRANAGHHCIAGDAATATAVLLVLLQRTAETVTAYIYNALLTAATGTSTTHCLLLLQVHLQRTACCCYRYIYNVLLAAATGTSTTHYLLLLQVHLQRTTCCCYRHIYNVLLAATTTSTTHYGYCNCDFSGGARRLAGVPVNESYQPDCYAAICPSDLGISSGLTYCQR
jgi:hypothetical protein